MPINVNGVSCILAGGVRETSNTTGTGNYSLNGAATIDGITYRTFAGAIGDGNRTVYRAQLGSEFEHGIGTITAPSTLSRDSILASSNGGSAVNWLTTDPKDIWCDAAAAVFHSVQASLDTLTTDLNVAEVDIAALETLTAPITKDANNQYTFDPGADDRNVIILENNAGQIAAVLRIDSGGNGRIQLRSADGDIKAELGGSTGQLWLQGSNLDGNEVGATQESAELAATANTTTNVAHGLASRPRKVWGVWRCLTAELGYSIGDEVPMQPGVIADNGAQVAADATNVTLITGGTPIVFLRKDTHNSANGTIANWRGVLRWEI